MDAIEGEDSDEFGAKIFDLSKNGCSLKIKCERQGDYPTYVSSRFAAPSKIEGMTDDTAEELYNNSTDLESVFPARSTEEMKSMLDEHFHCQSSSSTSDSDWSDDKSTTNNKSTTNEPEAKDLTNDVDPLDDDKVKELLDGLGDE